MSSTGRNVIINISPGQVIARPDSFNVPLILTRDTATLANGTNFQTITNLSQLTAEASTTIYKMVSDMFGAAPAVSNIAIRTVASGENMNDVLTALVQEEFYHILYTNTGETAQELTDIKMISDWAQNNMKQFFVALKGVDTAPVILTDNTNSNNIIGNNRTLALVQQNIVEHIEAPWVSRVMGNPEEGRVGFAPGRAATNFPGKTPDNFTLTKSVAIENANGNMYVNESGVNTIDRSYVLENPSAELKTTALQVLRRDWIVSNLRAAVNTFFNSSDNVSYTDSSISDLRSTIDRLVFGVAGERGFFSEISNPIQARGSDSNRYRYKLDFPTRAEVEASRPQDIAAKRLTGVMLSYVEAGSFDSVTININYF